MGWGGLGKRIFAARLSPMVRESTNLLPELKGRRHAVNQVSAARFTKSNVLWDLELTEAAMDSFDQASNQDQRALAVFLLFRDRTD